jgi:hypothetical protein
MFKLRTIKNRKSTGSGIVEGAVGLWLVVLGAVGATLLLANVGMAAYYKTKVGFVADECARYAANQARWNCGYPYYVSSSKTQQEVTALANKMLSGMGLPTANSVDVQTTSDVVTVKLEVHGMKLVGNGTMLPSLISMNETAVASLTDSEPPAILGLSVNGQQVLIPCYGKVVQPWTYNTRSSPETGRPAGAAVLANFTRNYASFDMTINNGSYNESLNGQAYDGNHVYSGPYPN